MSGVGKKKPVAIPAGRHRQREGQVVKAEGPKGALSLVLHGDVEAKWNRARSRSTARRTKRARGPCGKPTVPCWENVMTGVTKGFEARLEITGRLSRRLDRGKNLRVQLGS